MNVGTRKGYCDLLTSIGRDAIDELKDYVFANGIIA